MAMNNGCTLKATVKKQGTTLVLEITMPKPTIDLHTLAQDLRTARDWNIQLLLGDAAVKFKSVAFFNYDPSERHAEKKSRRGK